MKDKLRIVGVGGSLEDNSYSLNVLKQIMTELSSLGAETLLLDIKEMNLPLFDYLGGKGKPPEAIMETLNIIHSSDGLILTSPEYHGTVSATFKNFIDYLEFLYDYKPPYLTFKPVGCVAIGGGENSGSFTLSTMMNIVHNLRGISAPGSFAISNIKIAFDNNYRLKSEAVLRRLKRLADEVYLLASKLS